MFGFIKDADVKEGDLKDLFYIDTLELTAGLMLDQIEYIGKQFKGLSNLNKNAIESMIFNYTFINSGGNESTPVREVAAYTYLLFTSPNLFLQNMISTVVSYIHVCNIYEYAYKNSVEIPLSVLNAFRVMINDPAVFELALNGKDIKINSDLSKEGMDAFVNKAINDDTINSKLKDILGDLNITDSQNN